MGNFMCNKYSFLILGASVTYTYAKWNNFYGSLKESIKES